MEKVKFYDSRGVIPKRGEDKQSYLERARNDLDALQRFYHDVREKKVGPSISTGELRFENLENLLKAGEYEVLDNPSMREYGFSELFFPNIGIGSDVFSLFIKTGDVIANFPILYNDKKLYLTFVDKSGLEEFLPQKEISPFQYKNNIDSSIAEAFKKVILREGIFKYGIIHSIRKLASLRVGYHFEELVAYSPLKEVIWREYFSSGIKSMGLSLFHPFRSIQLLFEHKYLKLMVEDGVTEMFPLPLLARISFKEFLNIAPQMYKEEIKTIVNKKSESKSKDSWRWQLIAELCGY